MNLTISSGVSPSPALPPMVPRIPEIDFISDILFQFSVGSFQFSVGRDLRDPYLQLIAKLISYCGNNARGRRTA